jgi:DUF2934 family protein
MAKGKQSPAASKERPTTTTKSAGARSPGSKPVQARQPVNTAPTRAQLSPEEVYRLIQESAYFKAKARGFAPGNEVQDWIEAEAEVRRRLEGRAP